MLVYRIDKDSFAYLESHPDQARNPLEWFPFGSPAPLCFSTMPDPRLSASGFIWVGCFLGR
jgi:hypothetical protein